MALEKIKINDIVYECFTVSAQDNFVAIIKSDNLDEIENIFKSATSITIMNSIGQVVKTISDFGGIQSITKLPDYYIGEDNVMKSAIQVMLKKVDITSKIKMIENKLDTSVNEAAMTLEEYQEYRINQSKVALEEYLASHPITSTAHGGVAGTYAITKEKQDLMSQQYLTYQIIKATNPEKAILTWNESGEVCEVWTEEEFIQLIMEVKAAVYPLVAYQQTLEKQIRECNDKSIITAMVFDYDSVNNSEETN